MTSLRSIFDTISETLSAIGEQCLGPSPEDSVDSTTSTEAGSTDTSSPACTQILTTLPSTRYGCYVLRIGDKDDRASPSRTRVWGGNASTPPFSICPDTPETEAVTEESESGDEAAPAPVVPEHVKQLQQDLRALGFLLVGNPDGDFGRATEKAVREFQIYAGMEFVARIKPTAPAAQQVDAHLAAQLGPNSAGTLSQYIDSLEQVCNNARYTGPISGHTNTDTRRCIQHWLDNNWRCPVIVEAWNMSGSNRGTLYRNSGGQWAVNLWDKDDPGSSTPRVFYRDFTTYYTYPTGRNRNDMHALGEYSAYPSWGGPVSLPPRHCWDEAEVLTTNLLGVATPTGNTLSTFKVVRASSEQECIGHFDCVNAYDRAVVSVGPCHWTIALLTASSNTVSEGEMGGFISKFEHGQPAAFNEAVKRFGLKAAEGWVHSSGVADGRDLWNNTHRKFSSFFALQDESGGFTQMPNDKRDYVYLQNWHWFFRWVMAGRTIDGYKRAMWDMTRIRIRDILSTRWGTAIHGHNDQTIGDVFTSERAIGMLLRCHIFTPVRICSTNAGSYLRGTATVDGALEMAENETPAQAGAGNTAGNTLNWTTAPSTWTDDHEAALIRGFVRTVDARNPTPASGVVPGIRDGIRSVRDWPTWSLTGSNPRGYALANTFTSAGLSASRNSFDLDTTGLPPAV